MTLLSRIISTQARFRRGSQIFLLLLLILLPSGCVFEQMNSCVQYDLTVSAVTSQGEDITSSGVLTSIDMYLFDEDGFVRVIPKGSSSGYLFGANKEKNLTLVAWGNLKGDSLKLPSLAVGTSLEDAQIELLRTKGGYSLPVTDLFYARKELIFGNSSTRGMQNDTVKLVMERISAALAIKVSHAREYFKGEEGTLRVVVRGTGSTLDFLGEPSAQEAEDGYVPAMTLTQGKDEWTTPLFRVFPTAKDQRVSVDLYRNNEILFTITTDDQGNALKAVPGKETYITVDFRYARLLVNVSVLPWGNNEQQTEF